MINLIDDFIDNHPEKAANVVEGFPVKESLLFLTENADKAPLILPHLSPYYLSDLLEQSGLGDALLIIDALEVNQAAMALRGVNEDKRQHIVNLIEDPKASLIIKALFYSPQEIGFYVEDAPCVLSANTTIKQAMNFLTDFENTPLILVVDQHFHLLGRLDLLLLIKLRQQENKSIDQAIRPIKTYFLASMSLTSVYHHRIWDKKQQVPVVDAEKTVIGVITLETIKASHQPSQAHPSGQLMDEYVYFSEQMWRYLQSFWGGMR